MGGLPRSPLTGEGSPGRPITASEAHGPAALGGEQADDAADADDYKNADRADAKPEPQLSKGIGKGAGEENVRPTSPYASPAGPPATGKTASP